MNCSKNIISPNYVSSATSQTNVAKTQKEDQMLSNIFNVVWSYELNYAQFNLIQFDLIWYNHMSYRL